MNNIYLAFIISLLSGLATLIGNLFTYIKPKNNNFFIGISLSFSGSMMILISLLELIPEGFFYLNNTYSLLYSILSLILIILLSISITTLINNKIAKRVGNNSLYKVGVLSMIAMILHNLPEGIITFLSSTINIKLGIKLAIAIMLHNIPEGILIAVPIYYGTKSHKKAFISTLISGLSEPFGAILSYIFLYRFINNTIISYILIFAAGIMITISIDEIFKEIKNYPKRSIIYGILSSIILVIITKFLI